MQSPCLRKCKLHNGVCASCKRTIQEIKNWQSFTEKERNNIMKDLKKRK